MIYTGTVWEDDSCDFIVLVIDEPDIGLRVTGVVLDAGAWAGMKMEGTFYRLHINSLSKFYEQIT